MKTLPFTKLEAIGNNFVLIDALDMPDMNWPLLARRMCMHHFGVGADGLLVLAPSEVADFRFRMFNPDGSEDVCGNGLRCAAVYVRERGLSRRKNLTFEAKDGLRHLEIIDLPDGMVTVRVNMGKPSFRALDIPADLPVDEVIDYPLEIDGQVCKVTCVLVGTPHAVIFAPVETFWETIPSVSRLIETHPAFPERISVTWCACESRTSLRVRTWERAVGATLGCGTGACCALAASSIHGYTEEHSSVTSPGGTLDIEWPDHDNIFMSGPAKIVFDGDWPLIGDEEIEHIA